ncbi:MAG TPA: MogA/MoaB family molybdenum cofactor biosynthesis protein [Lachnospiraceae bacterium]|nr:MogA/MoaB family molybdenum cofactor biosynthesis protein [Lachnospiraceae bacterium]
MARTVYIITASTGSYNGDRADLSGPAAKELCEKAGYEVKGLDVLPDDKEMLMDSMEEIADAGVADLLLTTGGTGFSPDDVTPEATMEAVERPAPGIAEAIRANSMKYTDRACLSRAAAGIRGKTLIVNLPGSPKAVREALTFILPILGHGLDILSGEAKDCAR